MCVDTRNVSKIVFYARGGQTTEIIMKPHLDVKPMFVVIENFSCVFHCFFNDLHSSHFDSSVSILPWTTKCSSWCSSRRNVRAHLIVRRFGSWRIRPHPCHLKSPETWTLNAERFKFSPKITKIFPIDLPNCLFNAMLGNESIDGSNNISGPDLCDDILNIERRMLQNCRWTVKSCNPTISLFIWPLKIQLKISYL